MSINDANFLKSLAYGTLGVAISSTGVFAGGGTIGGLDIAMIDGLPLTAVGALVVAGAAYLGWRAVKRR